MLKLLWSLPLLLLHFHNRRILLNSVELHHVETQGQNGMGSQKLIRKNIFQVYRTAMLKTGPSKDSDQNPLNSSKTGRFNKHRRYSRILRQMCVCFRDPQ